MERNRITTGATAFLGVLYVAAGIGETVRAVRSGDGGLPFWFGTLVGGGTAVLVGLLAVRARPGLSTIVVVVGAIAGVPATMWTLAVPVFAVVVIVLNIKAYDAATTGT